MRLRHRLLLTNLFWLLPAFADQGDGLFKFFNGRDIDYWNEGKLTQRGSSQAIEAGRGSDFSGSNVVRAGDLKPFDWKNYQDPRSPEFWDDGGDWIPPRPFREAVSSPNTQNIDAYLEWQGKKVSVLSRFQEALARRAHETVSHEDTKPRVPWREIKIAYFYQSACPHCQSSKAVIEKARSLGADVTFVQLDHQSSPPLHTPSLPYDSDWARQAPISSTPTWVFSVRGKTARHTGAMRLADLETALTGLLTKETRE